MRFTSSVEFLQERRQFVLVHCCEQCSHFDPPTGTCVHGYPVDEHIEAANQDPSAPLVFCKEFELL